MELYIDFDEIAKEAKVIDLENALATVKALAGKKDLCLQENENAPQLILKIHPPFMEIPEEGYTVELVEENGSVDGYVTNSWKLAADCMRRFLAGRPPFPEVDVLDDDCPLCRMMKAQNG